MAASDFSRALGAHLADVMRERGITQTQVADRLGRVQGYVSERLNGHRAPETDLIDAVAALAHLTPHALMLELLARGTSAVGAAATPPGTRAVPSRRGHARSPRDAQGGTGTRTDSTT